MSKPLHDFRPFRVLTLLVFCVLGLGTPAHSFNLTFQQPQQCGQLDFAWTASSPSLPGPSLQFPLLLFVVPFSSSTSPQPIPKTAWNDSIPSGSYSMQIPPLAAGTQFVVGIMDFSGHGVGPVSQIMQVQPSSNTSCLSSSAGNGNSTSRQFEVHTTPDEDICPTLSVTWDNTVKSQRPGIKAFSPGLLPIDLDPGVNAAPLGRNVSTSQLSNTSRVVVTFRDFSSQNSSDSTSALLTVGGSNDPSCVNNTSLPTSMDAPSSIQQSSQRVTSAMIAGAIAAAVVGLVLVVILIACFRNRRRRKQQGLIKHEKFFPDIEGQGQPPPLPPKSPRTLMMSALGFRGRSGSEQTVERERPMSARSWEYMFATDDIEAQTSKVERTRPDSMTLPSAPSIKALPTAGAPFAATSHTRS